MPRRYAVLLAMLALGLAAASPAAARPWRAHCLGGKPGSRCWVWNAKVTFVADGDTVAVRPAGSGRTYRVRVTGINAQELRVYSTNPNRRRGECYGVRATTALARLIGRSHHRVRLYAQNIHSHSGHRLRRAIGVRIGGRWVDAGSRQLASGNALWLPNTTEYAWNRNYNVLAQRAALRHAGIWNPSGCGRGPSPHARLRVWVNWDAPGPDNQDVNGEWVRVKNLDPAHRVRLGGWVVRASDPQRFHLPRWASVPAGGAITVYVGHGSNHGNVFHWNQSSTVFNNAGVDGRDDGDGAYLFDPRGNMRASMTYPCLVACGDPLIGHVSVDAEWWGQSEYVSLRNVSIQPISLDGYTLNTTAFVYSFGQGDVLGPGETMRVYMDGSRSQDSRLVKHWGFRGQVLKDHGDVAELLSLRDVVVACTSWGDQRCQRTGASRVVGR